MAIFANGWVLVKTCQMYLFIVIKHHASVRSVRLEDCCNSQKNNQLETTSPNYVQVENEKLQSKQVI